MIERFLGIGYLSRIVANGDNQQVPFGKGALLYLGIVLDDNVGGNVEFETDAIENIVFFNAIEVILFSLDGFSREGSLRFFVLVGRGLAGQPIRMTERARRPIKI